MRKTTVYLADELKEAMARRAAAEHCSEAEVVRRAVETYTGLSDPAPRLPLFDDSGPPFSASEYVERALKAGFGHR